MSRCTLPLAQWYGKIIPRSVTRSWVLQRNIAVDFSDVFYSFIHLGAQAKCHLVTLYLREGRHFYSQYLQNWATKPFTAIRNCVMTLCGAIANGVWLTDKPWITLKQGTCGTETPWNDHHEKLQPKRQGLAMLLNPVNYMRGVWWDRKKRKWQSSDCR